MGQHFKSHLLQRLLMTGSNGENFQRVTWKVMSTGKGMDVEGECTKGHQIRSVFGNRELGVNPLCTNGTT
jgi:hypothetical protein